MNIIRFAIRNPVTVIVGVLLILLFGLTSLRDIPIQLAPSIERPIVTVNTTWPGATPYEIERSILEEQERRLKSIPGLYEMESRARDNRGQVQLTFNVGLAQDAALMRVSQKLDEVPRYPDNVDRPVIRASGTERMPIIWMALRTLPDNPRPVYEYATYFEEFARQHIERVEGVAELIVGGGVATEMQVVFNPERLAGYGIGIDSVIASLQRENTNISAGSLEIGRRGYRTRTYSEYQSAEDIRGVILRAEGSGVVTVGDVAEVDFGFAQPTTPVISNHEPGISIRVVAEPRANVLEVTDAVEVAINELNEGILKSQGLYLLIANEQRPYIRGAIALLRQNILIGGTLAILVLLLFLRSLPPTLVVSAAIPISIIGTFTFIYLLGSTLNAISLAGIAFAVGMLVDNAIVVLENIDRHRRMGKTAFDAAFDGAREVWGAVLASSLTTVAVFLPVLFLEDEAGQLFRDIAIAVTGAITLSLISAMTLIPAMSNQVFRYADNGFGNGNGTKRAVAAREDGPRRLPIIVRLGAAFRNGLVLLLRGVLYNVPTRMATIVLLVSSVVYMGYQLVPPAEYLPQGNRDFVSNVIIPPPGLSYEERLDIGMQLLEFFRPYYEEGYEGYPGVRDAFFIGLQENMIMGVVSADQQRTRELIPLCREAIATIPGVFGTTSQAGIFGGGLSGGRAVTVNVAGDSIDEIVVSARIMFQKILDDIPGTQVRPQPALELLYPELNFVPDRMRLRSVGMSAQELGIGLDVLMQGRKIGEFKQEGRRQIDLVLKGDDLRISSPEALDAALFVTPAGHAVPVASLARLERGVGLSEIRRYEQERTIFLQVSPPDEMAQQELMDKLQNELFPEMRAAGQLEGIRVSLSGSADKLTQTRESLAFNFFLAILISYLLMSALLGNFLYPFVIMFTVPMAAGGGLLGYTIVNRFVAAQQFDILTMLGFVILIGIVVNNAILIVYQSLNHVREEGMQHKEAIIEAVRIRIRPIFMSALTSICGMTPLILWPGPGSELYRGLGSVILGGLALSTIVTIFLIPALLSFFIKWEKVPEKRAEEAAA
jgi:HAE1 family hydrophobic/amphiphilic exporter-1